MADNKTEKQKVQEITDQLEKGLAEIFDSDKYKSYLSTMSKFHNYSVNNTLLIAMQRPDAQLIAGYQAWQKNFNRHVLRGEKAIKILAPAPYIIEEEREKIDPVTREPMLDKDGNLVKEQVDVKIPAFRAVSVFDVAQTDGEPIPELEVNELTGNVERYEDFEKALRAVSPVPIDFEDIPGSAKGYFHNEEKRIAIQEGMSETQTIKTMLHEISHALLHDRDLNQSLHLPEKDRNTKEVEAESVAFTVGSRFQLDFSDYTFSYIAGYSSGKDMRELKSSLDTIRTTASELISNIETQLAVIQKEREMEQESEIATDQIENLEAQLLYGNENQFGIYQLRMDDESLRDFRFTGTESLVHLGITKDNFEEIKRENYDLPYVGKLPDTMGLNAIYEKFNLDRPEDFKGHSLSVSDIVVLHKDGENTAHFVDSFGFTELPLFLEKEQVREAEQTKDIQKEEIQIEADQDEIIDLGNEPFSPWETELAFQLADRFITIQEVEDGYDYTIYDSDLHELDGGVYDNPELSIREALGEIVDDLKHPHYNEETGQYADSMLRGTIKAEDELIPMDYEEITEKAEEANQIIPPKVSSIIENFKEKTNECFHNIDDLSVEEVTLNAWAYVQSKIDEAGIDAHIVDLAIVGSRCRGLEGNESDLDIVMEFTGDVREDDFFNLLHEDGIQFGGVKVDINPITEAKTGTLETYLPTVEAYLEQKKQDQVRLQQENAVTAKPVEVSLFVAECSEFHDMGEFFDGIKSVDQAIDTYNQIPPERMHGVRSIGVQLYREGEEPYQDTEWDIMSGNTFTIDILDYVRDIKNNPEAMDKIAELIAKMPEKEVHGELAPEVEAKMWEYREQYIEQTTEKLAVDIDQFSFEYDTYGYHDAVEDREQAVVDIQQSIVGGETQYLKDWLQDIVAEGEPVEDVTRAKELISKLENLEKLKEYKPLAKVEELEESNYNMIDNVLNNGAGSEKEKKEESKKQQEEQTKPPVRKRTSLKERLAEKKSLVSGKPCEAPEKANDKNTERGL